MPTYYVDATGGNDGNTGLSTDQAWQTMGKVNGAAFVAGDSILFKRGETWTGTALTITWSGTAANPITFADYGTGNKPLIDGNDAVNCITNGAVIHDIVIQNFECTQGLDHGVRLNGACYNIQVIDCDSHDHGNDGLIFQAGVYNSSVSGGVFYDGYERTPGTQISGVEVSDGSHDITIDGVECYDNNGGAASGAGIFIASHPATTMPYNVTVRNAYCHGTSKFGIYVLKQDANVDADRGIEVMDSFFNANTDATAIGIRVTTTVAQPVNGVTFRRCEARENGNVGIYIKGQNVYLERCIASVRVTGVQPARFEDCVSLTCYCCTFYHLENASAYEPLRIQGAATNGIVMRNCILANFANAGRATIQVLAGATTGLDLNYNLYRQAQVNDLVWTGNWYTFANWQLNTGMDANSPAPANPLFQDAASDLFYLQHGSPALQVGTPLAGHSFYGAAPDCGRWEMRWPSTRTYQHLTTRWRFA